MDESFNLLSTTLSVRSHHLRVRLSNERKSLIDSHENFARFKFDENAGESTRVRETGLERTRVNDSAQRVNENLRESLLQ